MVYKQANNTETNKQKIKQGMIVRTAILYIISVNVPEDYSLLQYTVTVSVQQPIPYYTVHSHCENPTRPFPTTRYTITVSVQQDHYLPHSTKLLSVSNKTIPYHTVQSHCLCLTRKFHTILYTLSVSNKTIPCYTIHCTHSLSVSNKKIPYYTVHTHCLCVTKPFQTI